MAANGLYPGKGKETFYRPVPFDYISCGPSAFPVLNEIDDFSLSKLLVDLGAKLILSEVDKRPLTNTLDLVKAILAKQREEDTDITEVNVVGPYAKGTAVATDSSVELIVTVKTIPTRTAVATDSSVELIVTVKTIPTPTSMNSRMDKFCELMKLNPACQLLIFEKLDTGFFVRNPANNVSVRVMFTIPTSHFCDHKAEIHVDKAALKEASNSLRRTVWFIGRAKRSALENFVRILLDVKKRFVGMHALQDWHLELYAYHSLSGLTPSGQPISLAQAFKRFFQILSAGALLPDTPTLADPLVIGPACSKVHLTAFYKMEELDEICQAAQAICRLIMMGHFYEVLGLTPLAEGDPRLFSQKAYNPEDDSSLTSQ
uniref:DZF domain-containing protein n=1 Tax=Steinernema glaseri TaxID=37863 RepID=A0A1I7YCD0_9BILA